MNLKPYRLADLSHTVPMPDRGFRLFAQTEEGEMVDTENAFYATMIRDGDLVLVDPRASAPTPTPAPPHKGEGGQSQTAARDAGKIKGK